MLILDTHVLLWWVNGSDLLSNAAEKAIKRTLTRGSEIIVSSITAWEVSMLIDKGRLSLSMDVESWFAEISQIDGVRFLPVDNEIAIKSTVLPGSFHRDPADRMIVATARKLAIPLVTADEKIRNYDHVKTIW
jgi:PIN domain nuclease of toxin-antitoxin system